MLQQINLYKLLPTKSRFELTPAVAIAAYSVILLLLMLIYGVQFHKKYQINKQYVVLNNQVNDLQQRLDSLNKEYPISDSAALTKALDDLRDQLATKNKMLNLLTQKSNFSVYLLGLANTNMPDVWFTEILFNNINQTIRLKGFALQSSQVEQMLMKLNTQPTFSSVKFEVQNVTENPLPPAFEISASAEALL